MSYSISLCMNLKNNNTHSSIENLIIDSANDCNNSYIYYDHDLEGINNYIKKNNKIMIIEFENIINIINFTKFIKTLESIFIEYIYHENNIIYASNKYLNSLNKNEQDIIKIKNNLELNKNNKIYNNIYKIL